MRRKIIKKTSVLLAAALLMMQGTGLTAGAEENPGIEADAGVEENHESGLAVETEANPEMESSADAKENPEMESPADAKENSEMESPEVAEGNQETGAAETDENSGNETLLENNAKEPADNGDSGLMPISGIEDITPPTVTGIQLGAETVEAPGTLEVIVEAVDDVAGANYAMAYFRNTDTGKELYMNLYASYSDPETGKEIAYEDGKLHGTLEVGQYASVGTYVIKFIDISDKGGNNERYYGLGDESYNFYEENKTEALLTGAMAAASFTVTNSEIADVTAPTVEGIFLGQETVEAGGLVQVTIEAVDDVSGVGDGIIYFRNPDTKKQLYANLVLNADGKLAGTLETDQYTGTGNYMVEFVDIRDKAGNYERYYGQGSSSYEHTTEFLLPEAFSKVSLSVVNKGTEDITAPTVAGVTLKRDRVEVPTFIEVLVDSADDVSGVHYGMIYFRNLKTKKQLYAQVESTYYDNETGQEREYADGKLHGEVYISQYTGTGDYIIEFLDLRDKAGNYKRYYGQGDSSYENRKENEPDSLLPESCASISFYVYNDGKGFDVMASTQTPDLVEQIKAADDQAEILVDYSSDSILKKDIFDAIKGTGKTVSLVAGDGVQWIFQGSDIVNDSKDIDLRVSMEFITQSTGEAAEAIEELVEEKKTVILRFPENGVLPGKAKVRVKADYSMRQYLGGEGIYVYYFDNTANELVPIAANLVLTDDYYIEFEIEHCSYYIMTAGQVQKEEEPPKQPDGNADQKPQQPGNNGGQDKPENGKNDTVQGTGLSPAPTGQEAGPSVNTSPKTGEDTSGAWYPWGGIAVLAFLYLACQKAGRHSAF